MRKYLLIYKYELMSNLQYIFNILVGFVGFCILMLIFYNLWGYLYNDPKQLINGYSMSQMIWYVIVTEVLWMALGGRKLCKKIAGDVKGGNIAYNINKPYNYVLYSAFCHLGEVTIKFVLLFIIGATIGVVFLGGIPNINIWGVLLVVVSMILATLISTLLITFIGLISFYIEDANPLYWLYSKFILVLGTIFPIEYFPSCLQPVISYSPIYVVSYGPAKMFVDFSWELGLKVMLIQVIYLIFAYLLCMGLYAKGVRRLNVNGG